MITTDNIASHEFIGLETEIANSTNSQIIGLNGTIMDETKSMFTINTEKGVKKIAKNNSDWKFTIQGKETVVVNGDAITKRPFDRLGGNKA